MQLFFLATQVNWLAFSSEDNFNAACVLCGRVASAIRRDDTAIPKLIEGSPCDRGINNPYCELIENVTHQIIEVLYKGRDAPLCSIIGPCVQYNHPNVTGTYCYPCRSLTSLALLEEPSKRIDFIRRFCNTAHHVYASICSKIDDEPNHTFIKALESAHSDIHHCIKSGFCTPNEQKIKFRSSEL